MVFYFVTGNKNKYEEAKSILQGIKKVEQLELDLPEIQEIDAKKIIKAKLLEAIAHTKGEFMVEDTSLYLDCMNGLPGPLIKWFLQAIGNEGIYKIASKLGNKAEAKAIIGYAKSHEEIYFFEGTVKGKIVKPRGENAFGWDPIFQPDKKTKTFAEMSKDEKNKISHRRKAFDKLKEFLKKA